MKLDENEEFAVSRVSAPGVKLVWRGPAWLAPIARPKMESAAGSPMKAGLPPEGSTIYIWVSLSSLGVPRRH